MTAPTEEQRLAAKRGAYLLDKRMPGWAKRIDPTTLRMQDGCNCILGQLYSEYLYGVVDLGLPFIAEDGSFPREDHGFNGAWHGTAGSPELDAAEAARAAWLEQIAERVA